ncbi:MAG: hypothetical protein HY207_09110 [Nitrospirae bacterium]|nr:hypothetical protein [Nitrospirota bacterium]
MAEHRRGDVQSAMRCRRCTGLMRFERSNAAIRGGGAPWNRETRRCLLCGESIDVVVRRGKGASRRGAPSVFGEVS